MKVWWVPWVSRVSRVPPPGCLRRPGIRTHTLLRPVAQEDCFERSSTELGSSANYPEAAPLGPGYFSTDPSVNPQMYNWNKAFLRYCDGGSFSGRNTSTSTYNGKTLHFKGNFNLLAIQADLINKHELLHASDAVISGCSAVSVVQAAAAVSHAAAR